LRKRLRLLGLQPQLLVPVPVLALVLVLVPVPVLVPVLVLALVLVQALALVRVPTMIRFGIFLMSPLGTPSAAHGIGLSGVCG
jgi:hypothetical protein